MLVGGSAIFCVVPEGTGGPDDSRGRTKGGADQPPRCWRAKCEDVVGCVAEDRKKERPREGPGVEMLVVVGVGELGGEQTTSEPHPGAGAQERATSPGAPSPPGGAGQGHGSSANSSEAESCAGTPADPCRGAAPHVSVRTVAGPPARLPSAPLKGDILGVQESVGV